MTMYCSEILGVRAGTRIDTRPCALVVPVASYEPTRIGSQPSTPPGPSTPSKICPHFFAFSEPKIEPTHSLEVENTFTIAFGTGMVVTFGFLVVSCSAWTRKLTSSTADGLITCDIAGE